MKIIWNYIFIITGLSLLLQLAGIQIGGLSSLFNLFHITFNSTGIASVDSTSPIWSAVFGSGIGIFAAIGVGVIIGFFTRASPENFIILPFLTGTIFLFGSAIYSIIQYNLTSSASWVTQIVALLLLPFGIAFIAACVDYFRGGDF